jgi:ribosomal protein S18 acetylase RimI-like enzyme
VTSHVLIVIHTNLKNEFVQVNTLRETEPYKKEIKVTILVPMSSMIYEQYLDAAIRAYAAENVESGRWPEDGALERSRDDFNNSLPQGLNTPDNYLFEIKSAETGPTVGYIWFAVVEKYGLKSAFVYDVEVKPEFRRQGHARAAFEALEPMVTEFGLSSIGPCMFLVITPVHRLCMMNLVIK